MFRPSEMLVSFLQQLSEAGNLRIEYQGCKVREVVQLEYDKFLVEMDFGFTHAQEIRCDGITLREFREIVADFDLEYVQ